MKKFIPLTIILLILIFSPLISTSQVISASISPSELSTKPGTKEKFSLTVKNMGKSDIDVTGMRLRITSKELSGIPLTLYLGEYYFPFDEPERVPAGGSKVFERTLEVPLIPFAGEFDVEVVVETTGGSANTKLKIELLHSWLSISFLLISLSIVLAVIYVILKLSFRKVKRRKVYRINDLLNERDRYYKLLKELEGRKGKISESEYNELREEYSSELRRVQSTLDSMIPDLDKEINLLEKEISEIESEIRKTRIRVDVKEIKRSEAEESIEKMERILKEKRKKVNELRDLVKRIKGV